MHETSDDRILALPNGIEFTIDDDFGYKCEYCGEMATILITNQNDPQCTMHNLCTECLINSSISLLVWLHTTLPGTIDLRSLTHRYTEEFYKYGLPWQGLHSNEE